MITTQAIVLAFELISSASLTHFTPQGKLVQNKLLLLIYNNFVVIFGEAAKLKH